jgi:hypothetical protein
MKIEWGYRAALPDQVFDNRHGNAGWWGGRYIPLKRMRIYDPLNCIKTTLIAWLDYFNRRFIK